MTDRSTADDYFTNMALRNISVQIKKIFSPNYFDHSFKRSCHQFSDMFDWEPKEKATHTGQKWDKEDYRLCRFVGKEKLVNPNWGINLISDIPPTPVKGRVVSCDGGGGPTGHPKVYINLDKPGCHSCLYCGLRFFKEESSH